MATIQKRPAPFAKKKMQTSDDRRRIDLNLLTVFDAVMTERHVSRAAERLELTQSAVSNALSRLRLLLDDQLFVKSSRGVDPTPKAIQLWPRIHRALEDLSQTFHPQAFNPAEDQMQFRIAAVDITVALMAPHLHALSFVHAPHTNIFFVPHDPTATASHLMRGDLDFFIGIYPPRASVIETMQLWSDSFCLVARSEHPLMNKPMSVATFCATPQLAINEPGDWDELNLVDRTLVDMGLNRTIAMSVNQFAVVPDILQKSDLISVLPSRLAYSPNMKDRICVQPMPVNIAPVIIYLSWHKRNNFSAAHAWMKTCIEEAVGEMNRHHSLLEVTHP